MQNKRTHESVSSAAAQDEGSGIREPAGTKGATLFLQKAGERSSDDKDSG